jgi:PAT family beta-lactamase induction signal transducer AmpG
MEQDAGKDEKGAVTKGGTDPWAYVPTLYFAEGLPYILINTVSVILYKKMGIDNAQIAFWTSWLYLPWVIKMFWGPVVDLYSTKRRWVILTQAVMAGSLALIAFSLNLPVFFWISFCAFAICAFISATHDISVDGFYMLALSKENQALFVGIRVIFYRAAMIFGSGFLVYLAGKIETSYNNIPLSWMVVMGLAALVFTIISVYHSFILPLPESDTKRTPEAISQSTPFWEIFSSYFRQKGIVPILFFILFYRLSEAMLLKLASPFLLDTRAVGGLELSTDDVGLVYGTIGVLSVIFGGILGSWLISKYGLKKCLWPFALVLNLPHLAYIYMAYTQPTVEMAYPLVAIEQLGFGTGFTAFTVYLMYISRGEFKTSHYAISTGIMALGMMLPGLFSGYIEQAVGYKLFFTIVLLTGIPGILTLLFLPMPEEEVTG